MEIITTGDLAAYLDDVTVNDSARAELLIQLANDLVTDRCGTVEPIPTRVVAVTLEVVARAWRNPGGYSSETIDDYTYRRDAETRQAGVYLTSAEVAELQGIAAPVATAFSVDLGTPPWV